jgi:AmmeMemoRadiSam system protein A
LGREMLFVSKDYPNLARRAIEEYLNTGKKLKIDSSWEEEGLYKGVFVTLYKDGDLRGCIGTVRGSFPLEKEIINNAIAAATEDPRFYPVRLEDVESLEISVDILEPEEAIDDFSELDPKKYGVIVEEGYKRGLLLPDIEGVDTVEEQVEIAKRKAGIVGHEYRMKRFLVTRYEEDKK